MSIRADNEKNKKDFLIKKRMSASTHHTSSSALSTTQYIRLLPNPVPTLSLFVSPAHTRCFYCALTFSSKKSKDLTDARFSTMRSRDEKMNALKTNVLAKLSQVSSSPQYPQLLRFLIAQGLMTLMENNVTLQVRKEDLAIAKKELNDAVKLFQDTMKQSSGITPTINVAVDDKEFLLPAPVAGKEGASCTGGVLLSARNGQILCRNTLDHRLELAFDALKPTLRGTLFGVREKIAVVQEKKKHGGVSLPK